MPTWTEEEMETKEEKPKDTNDITEAGRYAVEVTFAKDKGLNRNGHAYWSIGLSTIDGNNFVCFDNLTIEGDKPHIAFKKMHLLGIRKDLDDSYSVENVEDLKGKRCFVTVGKGEYKGKEKLEPRPAKGTFFGYEPFTTTAPAEVAEDEVEDIDVPF